MFILVYVFGIWFGYMLGTWLGYMLGTWLRKVVDELAHT
jgi:hypothetical protein